MESNNVAIVQQKFIEEIQKNGIVHVLTWIEEWYGKAARAKVEDEIQHGLGEYAKDPEARKLALQQMLEDKGARLSNRSTSAGQELIKDAELSAIANLVRMAPGHATLHQKAWDAVRARLDPEIAKDAVPSTQ